MFSFLLVNVDTSSSGGAGAAVVLSDVNGTETSVSGLTPGVLYTFTVLADNDVSSQDNHTNTRSVSITATTEEGG